MVAALVSSSSPLHSCRQKVLMTSSFSVTRLMNNILAQTVLFLFLLQSTCRAFSHQPSSSSSRLPCFFPRGGRVPTSVLMTANADGGGVAPRPKQRKTVVRNFRPALSLPRVYRCATTDVLARRFETGNNRDGLTRDEDVLLHEAGLVLDLRSDGERDETRARLWTLRAPGGPLTIRDEYEYQNDDNTAERTVLRVDVLSKKRLFRYLDDRWLTSPPQRALASLWRTVDTSRLHQMRMDELNARGLPGLYEAMLETSQPQLRTALWALTTYLETSQEGAVVVHCVQGKDRTGMIVMLCQSVLGLSDDVIVDDYHASDSAFKRYKQKGSAAADLVEKGKLDNRVFAGAPREAMVETLALIRSRYDSVCPGYLDAIGFDESWRKRLRKALRPTVVSKL